MRAIRRLEDQARMGQASRIRGIRFLTLKDVPDELFRQVKAQAALRGMSMKAFILGSLRRAIEEGAGRP